MKKLLVIQQKMIGDVLTSTILCEHLKIHFPDSEVHFLINENTKAVVEGNPNVDKTILFTKEYRESKLAFYRFLRSIRKESYDVVIDVYCKLESNLISLFSKAKIKISYKKWYSKFIYTDLFSYSKNEETKLGFAIENRLLLLSPLINGLKEPSLSPKIYISKSESNSAKQTLEKNNLDRSKPILMVGILGSGPSKSYPLEYLAQIIDSITKDFEVSLLLNYMPSQKEKVKELLAFCTEKSQEAIHETVFCDSLRSFLGLLGQCNGYIGNEGGASNMAKALGVPNFSIFSPWISKKAWLTFNSNSANRAVHLSDFQPEILNIPKKIRKKNYAALYNSLRPELFQEQLHNFIKEEIFTNQ